MGGITCRSGIDVCFHVFTALAGNCLINRHDIFRGSGRHHLQRSSSSWGPITVYEKGKRLKTITKRGLFI